MRARSWLGGIVIAGAAVACGRFDFDGRAADASLPDAPAPFAQESGSCRTAESGPFDEVAAFPNAGMGYGVWAAPPFVMMADTSGGLHDLRFDGSAFTEVDHLTDLGWVEDVWRDGAYAYVASPGTGLFVVEVGANGALAVVASNTTDLVEARRGWISADTLYLPHGGTGLSAVRFDGTTLSVIGAPLASMSWAQGAWASGARVVFADADALRVVDFDGAAFHDALPANTAHKGSTRVWSADGHTVFVANADGATAYQLAGDALTELATYATGGAGRDVWSDGQHVFVASEAVGVDALAFDGTRFTQVAHVDTGGDALGVFGDGTYVYANDSNTGLHAFRGFACSAW